MGTIGSVVSLAMVSGPVLGGTVYHTFGYMAVFWVLGGMLAIDVLLRLLVIERKDAKMWGIGMDSESDPEPDENTALLNSPDTKSPSFLHLVMVIPYVNLSLIQTPRFLTASWLAFVVSTILTGPFDAVLPLHLKEIFNFNALTSGAMFAAVAIPEMILGPVAGWIVDHYGSKRAALIGFVALCPALFLLIIPTGPATPVQIISLIVILLLNG